jgi:hypothetical protein
VMFENRVNGVVADRRRKMAAADILSGIVS